MKKNYGLFASILLPIVAAALFFASDYTDDKPYDATYLGAVHTSGRSGSIEGVFRLNDGRLVDVTISPSLYVTGKIGDKYIINLSDNRINQTTSKNVLHILLPLFLLFIGGILIPFFSTKYP